MNRHPELGDHHLHHEEPGDLLYRDRGGEWRRLGIGAANAVLRVASGLPGWAALTSLLSYATTTELADVAAAEGAGASTTVPRGDHVHAHGSGYLPNAHHAQSHTHDGVDGGQVDHGVLTGLSDDDHPQYATNAEFDAHSARHADGGADEVLVEALPTAATDTALVLKPNGTGGVAFGAQSGGGPTTAYKAADETVNNSSTLQTDDALLLALAANEVWAFRLYFDIRTNGTADFKMAFTAPVGATGAYVAHVTAGGSATGATAIDNSIFDTTLTATLSIQSREFTQIHTTGFVINGANAGSLQLQWAQITATAIDTTVKAGSYLIAHKLSA